jgi:hypothetical protein
VNMGRDLASTRANLPVYNVDNQKIQALEAALRQEASSSTGRAVKR